MAFAAHKAMPITELPSPWSDSFVTVVLPTYNEANNIRELVKRLTDLPLTNLRIIVVDDNSPDGTADIAECLADELGSKHPSILGVLRRAHKDGLGRAYIAGMMRALDQGAQFVVQMDADLSHSPEYIPQMLGVLRSTDAGVVIGSRYVPGGSLANEWRLRRRMLSGWANLYVNTILSLGIRDTTAGFKIWRRSVLEEILFETVHSGGYSFQVEMNYRCLKMGHKAIEIPIHFEERHAGASKMNLKVKLESAKIPFILRWQGRRHPVSSVHFRA